MKKKIFTILSLLVLSTSANSQIYDHDAVYKSPNQANGYLIMDKMRHPDAVSWDVAVYHKVLNSSTNEYQMDLVTTYSLSNKQYVFIDPDYRTNDYNYVITGYNSNGDVVVKPNEVGPDYHPQEFYLGYVCNDNDYAYMLALYRNTDGSGTLNSGNIYLQQAPPPENQPYNYFWVKASDWNTWKANHSSAYEYYGLNNISNNGYIDNGNDRIISLTTTQPVTDYYGDLVPIGTQVYGVAKFVGPYHSNYGMYQSNTLASASSMGGLDAANGFIAFANQVEAGDNTPSSPAVACYGTRTKTYDEFSLGSADGNSNGEGTTGCYTEYYYYWYEATEEYDVFYTVVSCSIFGEPAQPAGGISGNGGSVSGGIYWPEDIASITIKEINGSISPIVFTEDALFDENGQFIGSNIRIPAGFYSVMYQYNDMRIETYFFEASTAVQSHVENKDFLSYEAYPVPITENSFSLNLIAGKKLDFTYELLDAEGNLLYTDIYTLQKDEEKNYKIDVPAGIPNGILFNKFIFADNSVISFQTKK